jgi:DNA-binding MarR family transcriptional regulator
VETIGRVRVQLRGAKPCEVASLDEAHRAIACLQRLAQAFSERRAQLAAEVGLTEHQWGVLEEISTEHFMPSLFADRRESTRAAVSKTIRQLLDKGLVVALVSKDDGRQRKYSLTPKGKRAMDQLRERRQQAIDDIWLKLDRAEVLAFTAMGDDIATRIEGYLKSPSAKSRRT